MTTYDEIPPNLRVALEVFADKLKEIHPRWPSDLEAQTTNVLRVLDLNDAETIDEVIALEALFEGSHNPYFTELPEGHTRRDRARRLSRCIQFALDVTNDLRDAQEDKHLITVRPGEHAARRRVMLKDPSLNIAAPDHVCPRCGEGVPTNERRGEYEGARSRTDNQTEICSPCGQHEAWEDRDSGITPQSEWPIVRPVAPGIDNHAQTWADYRSSHRRAVAPPPLPRELPDLRLHLMEKWIPGGPFEKALEVRGTYMPANAAVGERQALRLASLWWVKDEMVRLTTAAAKSIPDDLKGEDIDFPADQDYGLAVFGIPWMGTDALTEGAPIRVDALVWAPTRIDGHDCISMSMYRYFDFAGGLGRHDMNEAVATGAIFDAIVEEVGNGYVAGRSTKMRGGSWVFMGRSDWPVKETVTGFEIIGEDLPDGTPFSATHKASMIEDRKFFCAFATLVNHKLSETEMIWADRATRKRAARAGVDSKKEPSHVRLIKLREIRRAAGETDAEHQKRKMEYSHRFMVNGHWAWRRCGPNHANRRRTFIPPYVKGDEDLPLIIKSDVRVWTR